MHLILAGTGPCEPELKAAAPPEVTFLGFLDRRTQLPDLYANCDAFAFASLTETLGLVVLEAMASGLPVIAAPAGGVQDHVRDGVNGLTYERRGPLGDGTGHGAARERVRADPSPGARRPAERRKP